MTNFEFVSLTRGALICPSGDRGAHRNRGGGRSDRDGGGGRRCLGSCRRRSVGQRPNVVGSF